MSQPTSRIQLRPPPEAVLANCRAESYAILLIATDCSRCGCEAFAAGFWMPPGHELLHDADPPRGAAWERSQECRLLLEVSWLDAATAGCLKGWLPALRPRRRRSAPRQTWVHHCGHCAAPVNACEAADAVAWRVAGRAPDEPAGLMLIPVAEPVAARAEAWSLGTLAEAPLAALAGRGVSASSALPGV